MKKQICLKGVVVTYDLEYKKVKNINLRIKADGMVHVSANNRVSQEVIERFLNSQSDFILRALNKYVKIAQIPQKQYFSEEEICKVINAICEKVYPYYQKMGIKYPVIKFRKMVSKWGSCQPRKGILTFNTNLMFAPIECVYYVVWHEFTHFLQPNHSQKFYEELSKVCPGWKECKKKLREITIR